MARKKSARRPGRPKNDGPSYDVLALRKKIGAAHGVAQVSRETLAKQIGAAVGSIVNWERGMAPRPSYLQKLRDLERQVATGQLKISIPRRGRQPKGARAAAAAPASSGRGGRRAAASLPHEPSNAAPVLYANHVRVEEGSSEARLRFTLVMPGSRDVRAVADVLVPLEALAGLK